MIIESLADSPSDRRKQRSLLENEIRTADDPKGQLHLESTKTKVYLEDRLRNSNMNDRPAEGI